MKQFFSKEVKIALTMILSLVMLFVGINYLKGINLFKPSNYYYAKFESVTGLQVSAPVKLNGFQVGQVREIEYNYETNEIFVLLSLDKHLRIPKDSHVMIASDLLGTASMVLTLSDQKDYYNVGEEIPAGIKAGLMDKVTSDMLPNITQMLPKIDSILTHINNILANPAINTSVTRLDDITAELEQSTKMLATIMKESVPGVIKNVDGITANLNTTSANVKGLSEELKKAPLNEVMTNANSTMANLKKLTDNLNNKESSLGLLMNDKKLYNNLERSTADLDSLLVDFRKNPKRYVTFKVF